MHRRYVHTFVTGCILISLAVLAGCRRATPGIPAASPSAAVSSPVGTPIQPSPAPPIIATSLPTQSFTATSSPIAYPFPQPTAVSGYPAPVLSSPTTYPEPLASATLQPGAISSATQTQTSTSAIEATQAQPQNTPTATSTETSVSQYPAPQVTNTQSYPGPQPTPTTYPGPQPSATQVGFTPQATRTPTATSRATKTPSQSTTPGTPTAATASPTPPGGTPLPTPTELPPRPPLSPPAPGSHVSIWLSWSTNEMEVLRSITQSFQKLYPGVTFSLQYVPLDDLFSTYQAAAYYGQGPSLLLGPSDWGPELFAGQLISDLETYLPEAYVSGINPPALASGRYQGALISLPLSQRGVVMFRNSSLISTAPQSFDDLVTLSRAATHAGTVGAYLERGAYFSSADLLGLGGALMDDNDQPAFNDPAGLEWMGLLAAYRDAGAVTFNTNRDLDKFKRGRVGLIIDGTWNLASIRQALGPDNLAIDPWPSYGSGHLSGWVQTDSVFLNANMIGNDRTASLTFIGYLLDPQVQQRLAEVGHIPSVSATVPRDALLGQAMQAFSGATTYPITVDKDILNLYWDQLNSAIGDVFFREVAPADALDAASQELRLILLNSTPAP